MRFQFRNFNPAKLRVFERENKNYISKKTQLAHQ